MTMQSSDTIGAAAFRGTGAMGADLRGAAMQGSWSCRTSHEPVQIPAGLAGLPPLVGRVLSARGLTELTEASAFLDPKLDQLHDPSLIPDLDRAAERLLRALADDEPIVIFGDYDVDGMTASAILVRMLRALRPGVVVGTHIPHRLRDGYGLNTAALERLRGEGARVVVTVDCGITAIDEARAARDLGLDLIITDHHNPPASVDDLPDAYAVVHPVRPDSSYPFDGLCGAGVAFKLAWRLATMHCGTERVTPTLRSLLIELLGLASMGTIADVVPLINENRAICRNGLPRLAGSSLVGVRELIRSAGLEGKTIDAGRVGFALGPRLNATGRIGEASEALELLLTDNADRAASIARRLNATNEKRRDVERRITDEADEMATSAGMTGTDQRAIVLCSDLWHPGVVGIVCSRLVDRHHRPVVLCCKRDGEITGSGRSIPGVSLHAVLAGCADLLDRFGGHDMACGLRMTPDRFPAFAERFGSLANDAVTVDQLVPSVRYDCGATLDELTPEAVTALERIGPFGRGNPKVRVRLDGLRIAADPEPLGQNGRHAALRVADGEGRALRVIGWNKADRLLGLKRGQTVDLVVCPKLSSWQGRERVEAEIDAAAEATTVRSG